MRRRTANLRDLLRTASTDELLLREPTSPELVKVAIVHELARRREVRAVPSLRTLLTSNSARLRAAAADALGDMGIAEAGPDLVRLLTGAGEPKEVRDTAAYALGRVGFREAVSALVGALADGDASVRTCVASALAVLAARSATESLRSALQVEADPDVKEAFRTALAALLATKATPSRDLEPATGQRQIARLRAASVDWGALVLKSESQALRATFGQGPT